MAKHNLAQYLQELQARYPDLCRRDILVTWFSPASIPCDEKLNCWGWHEAPQVGRPFHQIYLLDALQKAPKYVVRYLLLHEVLHVLMPGPRNHPRKFQLAERAHPDFCRANAWLEEHAFELVLSWH